MGTTGYVDESPARAVWRASVPLMLGSSAGVALTLVDALFVARWSREAFTALVLTVPLASLVGAVGTGLAAAAGDAYGREGSGPARGAAIRASVCLGAVLGVVFALAGWMGTAWVPGLVGLDGRAGWDAERGLLIQYWRWSLPWMAFQLLLGTCVQLLSGMGRTREASRIIVAVLVTGVVLDPLLIFGLRLGIVGAALAMDVAFLAGLVVALRALAGERGRRMGAAELAGPAARQAAVAAMVFGAIGIAVVVDLVLTRLAASRGPAAVAVLGISGQVSSLAAIPTRGICGGFIAVFAADVAARRAHRYFPLYGWATALAAPFYAAGALLLLAAPGLVLAAFGAPAELMGEARPFFAIVALSLLVQVPLRIEQVGFLALGRPWAIAVQGALAGVIAITVAVRVLPALGTPAIALGPVVGNAGAGAVVLAYFFSLLRRRRDADVRDPGARSARSASVQPAAPA